MIGRLRDGKLRSRRHADRLRPAPLRLRHRSTNRSGSTSLGSSRPTAITGRSSSTRSRSSCSTPACTPTTIGRATTSKRSIAPASNRSRAICSTTVLEAADADTLPAYRAGPPQRIARRPAATRASRIRCRFVPHLARRSEPPRLGITLANRRGRTGVCVFDARLPPIRRPLPPASPSTIEFTPSTASRSPTPPSSADVVFGLLDAGVAEFTLAGRNARPRPHRHDPLAPTHARRQNGHLVRCCSNDYTGNAKAVSG